MNTPLLGEVVAKLMADQANQKALADQAADMRHFGVAATMWEVVDGKLAIRRIAPGEFMRFPGPA